MQLTGTSLDEIKYKEYLVTNGIGGYSSSSICGMNTRRYHGLLVASLKPPTQRQVLVSGIEDALVKGEDEFVHLSTNQYPGTFFPEGYQHIRYFERCPLPVTTFEVDGISLEKTVFMVHGSNTTVVEYRNTSSEELLLSVKPLFVYRDYHSLFHEDAFYDFYYDVNEGVRTIYPHYNASPFYMKASSKNGFISAPDWYRNTEYFKEYLRGLDFAEDRYSMGRYEVKLKPDKEFYIIFSTDPEMVKGDGKKLRQAAVRRWENSNPGSDNQFYNDLVRSADQFVVERESTKSYSIIAGYHWFTDWGRDTMISLLGLIDSGKKKEAKSILSTFIQYLDKGMLPNRFPDFEGEEPEYNTIDATLWLFVALYNYEKAFGDTAFIKKVYPKLSSVIDEHVKGTRYGIQAQDNGLLISTDSTVQLTWMDAKIGDYVVTPRTGYAVEINALWYNALRVMDHFSKQIQLQPDGKIIAFIEKIENSFTDFFWMDEGYLADSVSPEGHRDSSIRPNQIYVVSLPFSLLSEDREMKVVNTIEEKLVTPLGLRSLSQDHSEFRDIFTGNQWDRDTAYHQGTVWAFLMGDFLLSYLKVHKNSAVAKKNVEHWLEGFKDHFYNQNCIYGISEVFDGANPGQGKGCIQQAWSVFNFIRVFKSILK
jgi:predicted glycogen debranching enzyme